MCDDAWVSDCGVDGFGGVFDGGGGVFGFVLLSHGDDVIGGVNRDDGCFGFGGHCWICFVVHFLMCRFLFFGLLDWRQLVLGSWCLLCLW